MSRPTGIVCPLLTPFGPDGAIARDLYVAHAEWVLGQGAHYLSPFGTTGEAASVTIAERKAALEWLVQAGIPADRLMPGTGVTALGETAELTAHAVELGCAAAMVLPSHFFVQAGDEGQFRYYDALIARVSDPRLRMILYNIPQNSGVKVSPALTAGLAQAHPSTVVAYKDSSGDWQNTAAVIAAAPTVAVFPGSEAFLTQGLAVGAAGCISASVNLNAAAIRAVFDGARAGTDVSAADAAMKEVRKAIQEAGLIGAMKAALAVRSGDARWFALRPPLADATPAEGEALLARLGPAVDHLRAA